MRSSGPSRWRTESIVELAESLVELDNVFHNRGMSAKETAPDPWQLEATSARLQNPLLTGDVDLLNPGAGLHNLAYDQRPIAGTVLGVVKGADETFSASNISDAFVRGEDLVVTYAETQRRPFSVQVYWRATTADRGVVLLDTILSLQTDLLESYPGLATRTAVPTEETWQLAAKQSPRELELPEDKDVQLSESESDGIVVQAVREQASYAEMTHPADRGQTTLRRSSDGTLLLQRRLGGRFLEKGVIRRLRVRGVFFPSENDLSVGAECLSGLAREQPPLTV